MLNVLKQQALKTSTGSDFSRLMRHGLLVALVISSSVASSGCSSIDYKRVVYDALRQQDCIINELDQFCTRSFALDYYDYTAMRNDYMMGMETRAEGQFGDVQAQIPPTAEAPSSLLGLVTLQLN